MNPNKQIVLKYTPAAGTLELIGFLLILAVMYVAVTAYPDAPVTVPTHFNARGIADKWGPEEAALIQPILAVYLYIVVTGLGVIIRRLSPHNNRSSLLSDVLITVLCLKAVYLVYAIIITYCVMHAVNMPIWSVYILPVGFVVIITVGTYLMRRRRIRSKAQKQSLEVIKA